MTEGYALYELVFPNKKSYWGYTSYSAKDRFWKGHVISAIMGSRLPVHCAIRNYGPDGVNVLTRIITTKSHVKLMEIAAIAAFKTSDRRFGYNATKGGDGLSGDDAKR